jgi:hypothetical protein
MVFLLFVAAIVGSMWLYFKFFGKPPCGCLDKASP